MSESTPNVMEQLVSLCKRRGFIYPASEIYGGLNGFWDYGPLGTLLKNNIRDSWWRHMVLAPPIGPDGHPIEMVGIDSSIIQHPKTWMASGHVGGFNDPMRKCLRCGHFVRADHLWDTIVTSSKWFDSLVQEFTPVTGEIDAPRLARWARGKGKKLAPNLALVRNPEVTLSFLATRVQGQPTAPPDVREIARYLATEQLHATGLLDPCPICGGEMGEPQQVSLMFESHAGLSQSEESKVYLRPETAQGIFLNFKNIIDTMRVKLPFGVAQVGKSFRNEITPRNFIFRSREFEQMEMEWFCAPDQSQTWLKFWIEQRMQWWLSLGVKSENLRYLETPAADRAHYSTGGGDIEYKWPFTAPNFGELEGVAHRGEYDLKQHQQHSGAKLEYFDQEKNVRYLPHVIEPAAGLTRATLTLLCEAYTPDPNRPSGVYMKFAPSMAPIKAGIFPLVNKEGMPEVAEKLYLDLRKDFVCEYDPKQAIGKRYARNDEIGTPFCFTIDGQTLQDQTVTVRERDTASQQRIGIDKVRNFLRDRLDA